ncbi:MAG TPA: TraR/DksA C4-type zinc finger protein [Pyrinomonadaceae bacterium]|nr:TraR/DksA C4-type zinc finger protein [Pyrinomonadaceae bacterium]
MNGNRTIKLIEIPIGGKGGFTWNRLHGEREDICEALLKDNNDDRKESLQARLRKIDDALDRLMSGSYGNCSKCGGSIEEAKLDLDPALSVCRDCWTSEHGPLSSNLDSSDVVIGTLNPFDTILLRTHNSEYRILLLDPKTGRALVEGGDYLVEPSEALVKGSAAPGHAFKAGAISTGCRLEMWVDEQALLTSLIESVHVKRNTDAETVNDISAALH